MSRRPHLDFGLALHRELPGEGNLVWSPYSVASALGLVAVGARSRTRHELAKVIAPCGDLEAVGRMLAASTDLPDASAAIANTLWTRLGLAIRPAYLQTVKEWPGGAVRAGDFYGDPEKARGLINEDVGHTTRGLVQELLEPGVIRRETAAVLVNALYLRVAWHHVFSTAATRPAPFRAPTGTREVLTMRQQVRLGYAAVEGWRMASLPTASDIVVDLLLSEAAEALPGREALTALYGTSRSVLLDLTLPRLRVESAVTLNDPLARLEICAAFSRDADFSGITEQESILLDRVVHKAVLRVDEQGFEGAAATAMLMRTVAMELDRPVPFHVDRPFLLVVRHARTGAIFFLARIVEP